MCIGLRGRLVQRTGPRRCQKVAQLGLSTTRGSCLSVLPRRLSRAPSCPAAPDTHSLLPLAAFVHGVGGRGTWFVEPSYRRTSPKPTTTDQRTPARIGTGRWEHGKSS